MSWVAERSLARVDQAAQSCTSPLAALEAMFRAHIDFVAEHPGVPRMLFGELQRQGDTLPKKMVQTLIREYRGRLLQQLEQGKSTGEVDVRLDAAAAAVLFIGSIQGLVMQSLIAGDVARLRADAPGVWAIYRRGIGGAPANSPAFNAAPLPLWRCCCPCCWCLHTSPCAQAPWHPWRSRWPLSKTVPSRRPCLALAPCRPVSPTRSAP